MKKDKLSDIFVSGAFGGLVIGGAVGLIPCICTMNDRSGGNRTFAALGSMLIVAAIGFLIGPVVLYFYEREKGNLGNRERLDYFETTICGAVYGAVIGIMICCSAS
jgi:hypothetical protein